MNVFFKQDVEQTGQKFRLDAILLNYRDHD